MLYRAVGHTYVSIYFLGVTKTNQDIYPHFYEKEKLSFHGTLMADFRLHIRSCMTMLNNTRVITFLICNGDQVQYYEMRDFKNIYDISSKFEEDEFQNTTNELNKLKIR